MKSNTEDQFRHQAVVITDLRRIDLRPDRPAAANPLNLTDEERLIMAELHHANPAGDVECDPTTWPGSTDSWHWVDNPEPDDIDRDEAFYQPAGPYPDAVFA